MKHVALLLFVVFSLSAFGQSLVDNRQRSVLFKGVHVVSMESNQVLENQDVVVASGVITSIRPTGQPVPKNVVVVEAKGKYLMPGLAEMHAHVPPIDDMAPMIDVVKLFYLQGVTTIRGMLGHPRHLELRSKINSGEVMGPHFYTSGPSLNGLSVRSTDVAEKMVRDQKAAGYDFMKLHPGLTRQNFDAIVKTAKEVGMPYAGHVSSGVGVWHAVESDYATIDHIDGFIEGMVPGIEAMTDQEIGFFGLFASAKANTTRTNELMQQLKAHKVAVVPTQCLAERWISPLPVDQLMAAPEMKYMDKKTRDAWADSKMKQLTTPGYTAEGATKFIQIRRDLIRACQQQGVMILLGSDAPQVFNVPGFSVYHELNYLVDSGLTPYEALRSGTVNVATFYNTPKRGLVKAGFESDLVLLNGNPLKDIRQASNIDGVMLGYYWMDNAYRTHELASLVKP